MSLYIGLMSGTSADAIDAAIVDISDGQFKVLSAMCFPLQPELRTSILELYEPGNNEIDRVGELDNLIGCALADCVNQLLKHNQLSKDAITAIGSHGQTIRHRPHANTHQSFTLQIGNPNIIAQNTGIRTICDFRRRDMACGGQGAPLTPAFHQHAFASTSHNRAVVNIGGIANLTCLPIGGDVVGFDTGPGNGLMDAWVWKHKQQKYDDGGTWASSGRINQALLNQLMANDYIHALAPKSTGRESFCLSWLTQELKCHSSLTAADTQATLLEFTAQSISLHIKKHCPTHTEVYLCGGGVHNAALVSRLKQHLSDYVIDTTLTLGIPPDDVEAITFAWLAMRTWKGLHGNLPKVTGANQAVILGAIYPA